MAVTPVRMGQTVLTTTSETTLYTVPAGKTAIVRQVTVANFSGSNCAFSMSLVASGGTGGASNRVVAYEVVNAGNTLIVDLRQVLAAGGFVSVLASVGTALTVTASGVEIA